MVTFRTDVVPYDSKNVKALVASTGVFHDYEIDVAQELVDARLEQGIASGYFFIFAEREGALVGYSCFGPIACTRARFDLYWIAVHKASQHSGIGKLIHEETERAIASAQGERLYAETSSTLHYTPTRRFYESVGYSLVAQIADFYDNGDDKCIFEKKIVTQYSSYVDEFF